MSERPKVFVIGFSKTATTTLHKFFASQGASSVHWELPDGRFLAGVVTTNVQSGRPILAGIDDFEVYSEFSYADGKVYLEANYHFRDLFAEYPDAYFLLNTRPVDGWIESRSRHVGRNKKGRGALIDRIAGGYGVPADTAKQIWRDYHPQFHQHVRDFFAQQPQARFLEFDISTDPVENLINWVAPHYSLDKSEWAQKNVTRDMEQIRKDRRNPIKRIQMKFRKLLKAR